MRSRWGNAAFCEGTGKCVPAEENDRKHDFCDFHQGNTQIIWLFYEFSIKSTIDLLREKVLLEKTQHDV